MRAPSLFSGAAFARRLSAVWLTGCLVAAAAGCTSALNHGDEPGETGAAIQAVGTPPVSMMDGGCRSDPPCAMPLIAAGWGHTVAVRSDGTVWAWGYNGNGQLGDGRDGTTSDSRTPVQVMASPDAGIPLTGVSAVAAGTYFTVALANGTAWAWGNNDYGQLGNGTSVQSEKPVQVMVPGDAGLSGVTDITAVAAGYNHTVALKSDGTIWAWGHNGKGQLGNGSSSGPDQCGTSSGFVPCSKNPVEIPELSGITAVAAGGYHTVALKADGTVWAWGNNYFGQLGNGTTDGNSTPVQVMASPDAGVALTGISAIAAGQSHTVAFEANGTVWAWGYNFFGQVGDGTTDYRTTPVQVMASPDTGVALSYVSAIAAGANHTVALKADGTIWAWGYNNCGQLGNGTTDGGSTPVQVMAPDAGVALAGISAIAAGEYHTVALKADGTIWAWGLNGHGQLGDGTIANQWMPVNTLNYFYPLDACKTVPACSNGACAPKVCGEHGTCESSGTCSCNDYFFGSTCTECADNRYGYPDCTFCEASITCSGHGTCDATGSCICSSSTATGFFAGSGCDQCAADYYGYPACKTRCTIWGSCNGNGSCDTNGSCDCNPGFAGTSCNECATDGHSYGTYPDCKYCLASDTCSGHGGCGTEGSCACAEGFAGAACDRCAVGYSGYPECVPVGDAGAVGGADSGAAGRENPTDPYSLIGCGCVAGGTAVDPLALFGLVGFLIARGAARKPHPPAPPRPPLPEGRGGE